MPCVSYQQARVYLLSAGFSLAFGSMFTKTYRVHRIFTRSRSGVVKNKVGDIRTIILFSYLVHVTWPDAKPIFVSGEKKTPKGYALPCACEIDVLVRLINRSYRFVLSAAAGYPADILNLHAPGDWCSRGDFVGDSRPDATSPAKSYSRDKPAGLGSRLSASGNQ